MYEFLKPFPIYSTAFARKRLHGGMQDNKFRWSKMRRWLKPDEFIL